MKEETGRTGKNKKTRRNRLHSSSLCIGYMVVPVILYILFQFG